MVAAQFGDTYRIENENLWDDERTHLNISVVCIDPKRIPFSSTLPYNSHWKECHFEIKSWGYVGDHPPEAIYEASADKDARSSLLKAYGKLMNHQSLRSPPPSSSSSTEGSSTKVHEQAVDQEYYNAAHYEPGPGVTEFTAEVTGTLKRELTGEFENKEDCKQLKKAWEPLSEPKNDVAIQIGDFPVVCQELQSSTLFVGSHEIGRHIRSDLLKLARNAQTPRKEGKEGQLPKLHNMPKETAKKSGTFLKAKKEKEASPSAQTKLNTEIFTPKQIEGKQEQKRNCNKDPKLAATLNAHQTAQHCKTCMQPKNNESNWTHKEHLNHSKKQATHTYTSTKTYIPPNRSPPRTNTLQKLKIMDATDEQFLLQFASINPSPPVTLPDNTVHTRDWNLCALAAVIIDRNVIEANFEKMMIRG